MKRLGLYSTVLIMSCLIASLCFKNGFSQTDTAKKNVSLNPDKYQVQDFNSLDVSGWVTVELKQGAYCSVKIEGSNQAAKSVRFNVKNNTLNISGGMPDKKTVVIVTCKDMNSIVCSGVGSFIKSSEQFKSDALYVKVSGIARTDLNLDVKKLTTKISGASVVALKGSANVLNLKASGASIVNASELMTSKTYAKISGASTIKLNVKDSLIGDVSGASNISFKQKPAYENLKASGVANIDIDIPELDDINDSPDKSEIIIDDTLPTDGNNDTVKIKMGRKRVLIINENRSYKSAHADESDKSDEAEESDKPKIKKAKQQIYWSGVGIGINGYLNSKNSLSVPADYEFLELDYGKSVNVNINVFDWHLALIKNYVNLVTGIGLEMNNYRFENNYTLTPEANTIKAIKVDSMKFKRNKLTTAWIDVPLLLQFDTKKLHKNSTLHLSAGIVGALRINSHTKQVYDYKDKTYKPKSHDDFNQEPLKVSAMVRLGYGKIDLFATYALNSMFKSGQGPELYPFTVGINLVNF